MGYSIEDFVKQLSTLEGLLGQDFRGLSMELRRMGNVSTENNVQFRLVEQLQYHDIIRQKIEHVRELLEELIAESADGKTAEETFALDPQLIELAMGLLRYTREEYQGVISLMQKLMASGEVDPEVCPKSSFDLEIQALIKSLEKLYLEVEEGAIEGHQEGKAERFRKILKSFSMKSERDVFSVLFDEDDAKVEDDENPEGQVELF